ncbi:MAG: LLM class flavin-dependent oxidoreductase [Candidatus Tectomicrobia bacterium]|nr:LLM class flavin-dependent oxidoreductase [Candidatus Tectomicrobia bacterium]
MRLGLTFSGMDPMGTMMEFLPRAEAAGIGTVFFAEHVEHRDALVGAAAFLGVTERMRAVPTALSPYLRHPMMTAMAAATLNEAFPGRVVLMYGAGAPAGLEELGMRMTRPLRTIREAVEATRLLFSGETVHYDGEIFPLRSARLSVRPDPPVPIHLAAVGPEMLRLAGEIADGVCLSAACTPAYYRWAIERVLEGARRTGRKREDIEISAFLLCALGEDREEAMEAARGRLLFLFGSRCLDPYMEVMGAKLDLDGITGAMNDGDWERARTLIPDEVVAQHAVAGHEEECRAGLASFAETGLDLLVLRPLAKTPALWGGLLKIIGGGQNGAGGKSRNFKARLEEARS